MTIAHLLKHIHAFVHGYGMLGVFILMAIENLAIPLPTEAGFLVANELIQDGKLSFWLAFAVINAGHLAGATIAYRIGLVGDNWVVGRYSRNERLAEAHRKLHQWYERHGEITVFLARLVGYVRPYASLVAGFAEVRFVPFVAYTLLGSMVINLVSMVFTHILVLYWQRFAAYHLLIGIGAFTCFFGGAIIYGVYQRRQGRVQE